MSSRTATPTTASTPTPVITSVGAPLDEIAALARRRANTMNSDLGADLLVQRTLQRFDETFGTRSCPLDLDGWIRRAVREIDASSVRRPQSSGHSTAALGRILEGLCTPVRSPALTKQRKMLLRRVNELVGSGVRVICLLALSDSGAPAYDHELAAALSELGVPAFACTPDAFPDLLAVAIGRGDVAQWASAQHTAQSQTR